MFLPVNACGMGTVFCERAAAFSMLRRTVFSLSVVISRSTYLFRIKWNIISFQFFQSGCLPFTQKIRNFGWNVIGKINVVSTKGNFLAKRGFLETVDQNSLSICSTLWDNYAYFPGNLKVSGHTSKPFKCKSTDTYIIPGENRTISSSFRATVG